MQRLVIIGAGGFAREVGWLIDEINGDSPRFERIGHVVSDLIRFGSGDGLTEILGDFAWLREHRKRVDALAIGIGDERVRLRMARELQPDFPLEAWPTLIHPNVRMNMASCTLGHGVILCAGTILTVNVEIGDFTMLNLACTVGHEARIGRGCVLNPTVNVSGDVIIEDEVLIGTGVQLLNGIRVGRGARVGAGAVVTRDVAPGETVAGVPAKPLQQ
jgi:sugar O-acyltransferase (sialic acid O-acetyltransferase NeuD family)